MPNRPTALRAAAYREIGGGRYARPRIDFLLRSAYSLAVLLGVLGGPAVHKGGLHVVPVAAVGGVLRQRIHYTANGNYIVTWAFNWTPAVDDWRAGVVDALTQYTANGGNWDNVKSAFVDGWATQYAKENG